ncbi:MAG: hypothetical protein N2445_05640 [Acidobacteria bacterium]|nr:hypothetical protein [Acidobacteriota bacterium]
MKDMITGYNQDVVYKGKVYHVQTEDRGESNPIIETLIYVGGEILSSYKTSYKEMLDKGCSESEIAALLEKQHRKIVVDIKLGKHAKEPEKSFGEGIVSNKSLDEVILEYLTNEQEGEKMKVVILDQSPMVSATKSFFKVRANYDISDVPIDGAEVSVKLVTVEGLNKDLFSGKTNHEGLCNAVFNIPPISGSAAVVLTVAHQEEKFENKVLVTK